MDEKKMKNFAEYDYSEVTVKNKYEALYCENYPQFGWVVDGIMDADYEVNAVTITFKRDRKIQNKTVLTRLQRQFETAAKEIARIERSDITFAIIVASFLSLIAAGILACAVFLFLDRLIDWGIALSVLSGMTATLAWLCFLLLRKRKRIKNQPLIRQQYCEISDLIDQAKKLLLSKETIE